MFIFCCCSVAMSSEAGHAPKDMLKHISEEYMQRCLPRMFRIRCLVKSISLSEFDHEFNCCIPPARKY
jgi:hypothetical protein